MDATNNFKKIHVDGCKCETPYKVSSSELAKMLHDTKDDMMTHMDIISSVSYSIGNIMVNLNESCFMSLIGTLIDEYLHHNNLDYEEGNVMLKSILHVRKESEEFLKNMTCTEYPKFED